MHLCCVPCVPQAELGAFYPLLVLRPLELEEPGAADLAGAAAVLPCLGALCSEAQLLVDMFVNYDCDLRAPNLYERTVQVGAVSVVPVWPLRHADDCPVELFVSLWMFMGGRLLCPSDRMYHDSILSSSPWRVLPSLLWVRM